MRVVEIARPGGPEVLEVATRPELHGLGGLEPAGCAAASGRLRSAAGRERSAWARGLGGNRRHGRGQRLVGGREGAAPSGGGYVEYAKTPGAHCLSIPDGLSLREAACLPETFFTVWPNVFGCGGLRAGERFLGHGGSSGIGTVAIQLARHFGARVFATAGSDAKRQTCTALGAERVISHRTGELVEVLRAEGGADLIHGRRRLHRPRRARAGR